MDVEGNSVSAMVQEEDKGKKWLSSSDTQQQHPAVVAKKLLPLPALSQWEKSVLEGSFPSHLVSWGGLAQFLALSLKALEMFDAESPFSASSSSNSPC